MKLEFDYSGAELFFTYIDGKTSIDAVLHHPAYQIISKHAQQYAGGITAKDIERSYQGESSSFYGLKNITENAARISSLLKTIQKNQVSWNKIAVATLSELFPSEDITITIYPTLGYDMGIGLANSVCMNCNCELYLNNPLEFLFFIIHECVHVIYEHHHSIPTLHEIATPTQWQSYFSAFMQNEGYAVYAPFYLRKLMNQLDERDYRVLINQEQLNRHVALFWDALTRLKNETALSRDEYLEICFGDNRLTYRVGCELICRINLIHGLDEVRSAFLLSGDQFIETYKELIYPESGTRSEQCAAVFTKEIQPGEPAEVGPLIINSKRS